MVLKVVLDQVVLSTLVKLTLHRGKCSRNWREMILITIAIDLIFAASLSKENAPVVMLVLIGMKCQRRVKWEVGMFSRAFEIDVSRRKF